MITAKVNSSVLSLKNSSAMHENFFNLVNTRAVSFLNIILIHSPGWKYTITFISYTTRSTAVCRIFVP